MGYLTAIIILSLLAYGVYRLFNTKSVDLHEERAELKADLVTTLSDLEELDELIEQERNEEQSTNAKPLRLLKKKVASKRVAVKNTLGKVDLEGELNWDYRKLQAKRTIAAAKKVIDSDSLAVNESQ